MELFKKKKKKKNFNGKFKFKSLTDFKNLKFALFELCAKI